MTELNGSEKQITWATNIRLEKMQAWALLIKNNNLDENKVKSLYGSAIEELKNKTDSKFWIDHVNYTIQQIVKEVMGK